MVSFPKRLLNLLVHVVAVSIMSAGVMLLKEFYPLLTSGAIGATWCGSGVGMISRSKHAHHLVP
jgi:hypothetical protein